jgi:hypothetical protein
VNFLREMAAGFVVMVNGWLSTGPRKNPGCVPTDHNHHGAAGRYHRRAISAGHGGAAAPTATDMASKQPAVFCRLDGPSFEKLTRLPAPRRYAAVASHHGNHRPALAVAKQVNNRTQKSAVNPLTRPASRPVMRGNYPVAAR